MKKQRIEILQKVANRELTPEQADEKLLGLSNVRDLLLSKLEKIDKIARGISGYYTGFGLPLDGETRRIKHKKEIDKMINVLKQ